MLEQARSLLPLATRDLVAALGSREDSASTLEYLARRRAAVYANASAAPLSGEAYWTALAAALAPEYPADWMPMHGLIEHGATLEGGAKGLRGLFTKAPSDRERKRVQKTATLAGRVMQLVANSDQNVQPEEVRLAAMAMASFGLSADELAAAKPQGPVNFDNLEIFGDLDTRTRRELVRGAWQLALIDRVDPQKELAVRTIAARLEASIECDAIRAEVVTAIGRQSETAAVTIELVRGPARTLPPDVIGPWLAHLVTSCAPPAQQAELLNLAHGGMPPQPEAIPRLDSSRRRQALALAVATLVGHDPTVSTSMYLRAALRAAAAGAGMAGDVDDAIDLVNGWLAARIHDVSVATPDAPAQAVLPAPPTAPRGG